MFDVTKILKIKEWYNNNNVKKIQIIHLLLSCLDASTLFHFPFEKISTTTVCTWTDTIYRGVKR